MRLGSVSETRDLRLELGTRHFRDYLTRTFSVDSGPVRSTETAHRINSFLSTPSKPMKSLNLGVSRLFYCPEIGEGEKGKNKQAWDEWKEQVANSMNIAMRNEWKSDKRECVGKNKSEARPRFEASRSGRAGARARLSLQ